MAGSRPASVGPCRVSPFSSSPDPPSSTLSITKSFGGDVLLFPKLKKNGDAHRPAPDASFPACSIPKELLSSSVRASVSPLPGNGVIQSDFAGLVCDLSFYPPQNPNSDPKPISPPPDVVNQGHDFWGLSLVGHFLDSHPHFLAIKAIARKLWTRFGIKHIAGNDAGFFFFRFSSLAMMNKCLLAGPWVFSGKAIFLRRWTPGMELSKAEPLRFPIWIKLSNIPIQFWTLAGLSWIASSIGVPLRLDPRTARLEYVSFAKICVEVGVDGPFPDCIAIKPDPDSDSILKVNVEYLWKPTRCDSCHLFGHDATKCRTKQARLLPYSPMSCPLDLGSSPIDRGKENMALHNCCSAIVDNSACEIMASPLPPHIPADSDVSVQGNLELVSDISMSEDVAFAPSTVVVGDYQSALLFVGSESNLVESKLKEERVCSSSGSENASLLLPPSLSDVVVGLVANVSEEVRFSALVDSPMALESVQNDVLNWGLEDSSTLKALSERAEGSEAGSSRMKLECCGADVIFDAPGIYEVDTVVTDCVSGALPCVLDEKELIYESNLQLSEHLLDAGVPVAKSKNAPGQSVVIDPNVTPESISRIVREYCLTQSGPIIDELDYVASDIVSPGRSLCLSSATGRMVSPPDELSIWSGLGSDTDSAPSSIKRIIKKYGFDSGNPFALASTNPCGSSAETSVGRASVFSTENFLCVDKRPR